MWPSSDDRRVVKLDASANGRTVTRWLTPAQHPCGHALWTYGEHQRAVEQARDGYWQTPFLGKRTEARMDWHGDALGVFPLRARHVVKDGRANDGRSWLGQVRFKP